jgi:hypothetical protein
MPADERFSFSRLIRDSKRFGREEYVINIGGLVNDVSDMLGSDMSKGALEEARKHIEMVSGEILEDGKSRLRIPRFGDHSEAPELIAGQVAAVDGKPVLSLQKFSAGQALCVGIGSRSYQRPLADMLHGYTSKGFVSGLKRNSSEDIRAFLRRVEDGIYGISQTAYMRYFEAVHALEISEPLVFCDGTLVYEWLINQDAGREVYKRLIASKKAIGVIKSTKESIMLSWLGRALEPGEVFIYENLYDHFSDIDSRKARGAEPQWHSDTDFVRITKKIVRGVFKPAQKHFGFECHIDHIEPMLRVMAADCQMNLAGHEIPFLLNDVDKEIANFFKPEMVKMRISEQLARDSESLFMEETGEREFR